MSSTENAKAICKELQEKYSSCDIADALHVLKVPCAGSLPDIFPNTHKNSPSPRLVAPISTVLFVPKSHQPDSGTDTSNASTLTPTSSNLSKDQHWTDVLAPGSIALLQQPQDQICALLGDLIATRLKIRGLAGAIIDGRMRDIAGCSELCSSGDFCVCSRATATVGTTLEAKPWAVDVPIKVGGLEVHPGDFLVVDEAEKGLVVIPKAKLQQVATLLPELKEADDGVLREIQSGAGLQEAFQKNPGHYVHRS